LRASDLLPILDRFLEAVARTRREKALAKATQRAEVAISQAFQEQGRVFIESWARAARRAGLREGPLPPPTPPPTDPALALPWEPAFSDAEIATLQLFEEPIQALVEDALLVGAREAIAYVSADISFSLANPRAVAFLEQYGARRVTMINETTRDEIRRMVTRGVEQGLSYDQVAKDITARFREFAVGKPQRHVDSRAHLVAVTEAGEAYEEGNAIVGQTLADAGIEMEKKWSTTGDNRVSDGCRRNQSVGWIPMADAFPSGHMRPLRFPGCRCAALYQRKPPVRRSDGI
jgi:hypothetical protein